MNVYYRKKFSMKKELPKSYMTDSEREELRLEGLD